MAKPDETFPPPLTGRGPDAGKPAETSGGVPTSLPKPKAASPAETDARKNARKPTNVAAAVKRSTLGK